MASWISKRKRGGVTITENRSKGTITQSTSTGNKQYRQTFTQQGGKLYKTTTERSGDSVRRTRVRVDTGAGIRAPKKVKMTKYKPRRVSRGKSSGDATGLIFLIGIGLAWWAISSLYTWFTGLF